MRMGRLLQAEPVAGSTSSITVRPVEDSAAIHARTRPAVEPGQAVRAQTIFPAVVSDRRLATAPRVHHARRARNANPIQGLPSVLAGVAPEIFSATLANSTGVYALGVVPMAIDPVNAAEVAPVSCFRSGRFGSLPLSPMLESGKNWPMSPVDGQIFYNKGVTRLQSGAPSIDRGQQSLCLVVLQAQRSVSSRASEADTRGRSRSNDGQGLAVTGIRIIRKLLTAERSIDSFHSGSADPVHKMVADPWGRGRPRLGASRSVTRTRKYTGSQPGMVPVATSIRPTSFPVSLAGPHSPADSFVSLPIARV